MSALYIYIKLATNQYVKNSLYDYLKFKDGNKDKMIFGWNESKILLFEYCNIEKNVPTKTVIYEGQCVGKWLQRQK
jgi:hypothetical protein